MRKRETVGEQEISNQLESLECKRKINNCVGEHDFNSGVDERD